MAGQAAPRGSLRRTPAQRRAVRLVSDEQTGTSRDRRAKIVDAASRLFAEYGYEATRIRQIADDVGLLNGSLYHHFANKEEILGEVMKVAIDGLSSENERLATLPASPEHQLVAMAIMRFRQYIDNWQFHAILLQEDRFFRQNPDFAYVLNAKSHIYAIHRGILQNGVESGQFRQDLDVYLSLSTISRLLSAGASWWRMRDHGTAESEPRSFDTVLDYHLDSVLRLVRAPERIAETIPRATGEQLLAGRAAA